MSNEEHRSGTGPGEQGGGLACRGNEPVGCGPTVNTILQAIQRFRVAVVLVVFATLFVGLSVSSYVQKSLAIDEDVHILEGYQILARGCHIQTDFPPLLDMLGALPLWIQGVRFDPARTSPDRLSHAFFYEQNDCDRILLGPRFLITLLGVMLGLILFFWARELHGFWPATAGLALYAFEPTILCNAGVVTQDLGMTCFFFGTMYFLWRVLRRLTPVNVAGLAVFFALAHLSKFTGFLLGPLVIAFLLVRVAEPRQWPLGWKNHGDLSTRASKAIAAAGLVFVLGLVWFLGVWMTYGFRYTAPSGFYGGARTELYGDPVMRAQLPVSTAVIGWIDEHHLLPNAYTQNFLRLELNVRGGRIAAFLMGRSKFGGWWYYFPVVFLIKTPFTILILFFAGVVLHGLTWRNLGIDEMCVLLPMVAYMAATMHSDLNIGVRHLLPMYPFAILVAVVPLAESLRRGRIWPVVCLCLFSAIELATVYPHYRGFFNIFAGGPEERTQHAR